MNKDYITDQEKAERLKQLKQCGNVITVALTIALGVSTVALVNAVKDKDLDKIDQIK